MKYSLMTRVSFKSLRGMTLYIVCFLMLCALRVDAILNSTGRVDVHVANATFVRSDWPSNDEEPPPMQDTAQDIVCKDLKNIEGVAYCFAFFDAEDNGDLAVHMEAHTTTINASYFVYNAFNEFISASSHHFTAHTVAENAARKAAPLSITWRSGVYTMPCRGIKSVAVLPTCASTKNCGASLVIEAATGSIESTLCSLLPSPCEEHLIISELINGHTQADIDASNALEVALQFTNLIRKNEIVGAKRVFLQSGGRTAQLYALDEKKRYQPALETVVQCDPIHGLWTLSLLCVIPVVMIAFRCIWYRRRRQAKKAARRAIIDNELQLQLEERQRSMSPQSYAYNPSGYMYPQYEDEEREAEYDQELYYYPQREGNEEYEEVGDYEAKAFDDMQYRAHNQSRAQARLTEEEAGDDVDNADEYVEPDEEMSIVEEDEEEGQAH